MKKKTVCTVHMGDQEYEDTEGEGSRNNTAATGLLYSEADRCPICLTCLLEKEVGFPESCNHVFCMTCILKWAETLASCPIDRKPFQAVFKFSALDGCIKVQVKRQLRDTKEKKNEISLKKQLSCHERSEGFLRKKAIREDLLSARFYDLTLIHRNASYHKTGGKKNAAIKIDKPRRSNQCTSYCFRNFFSNIFSSGSHNGDSSFTRRAYCTEFMAVNEISALIGQKRQELELSWFPDSLPGIGRIGFIPWNVEAEVLPLISYVLPRTIFPTSTISLENFGPPCKGYALAHTQEGEEKKQTSGTSNTRGTRRKPAATPTRRSTRNTKAETVSQSQISPTSNNSGCDAPGNNNPSVSVFSPAESEKQTRQAPKRKSVRRGRKPPVLKKKLRRSVPPPEKSSSSDSVEEETLESDAPPVLEKEQQSDVEESTNIFSVQTDVENQSAKCLKSCSEQIEENECKENHDVEEKVESSYSGSCTDDPPVLVREGEEDKPENTGVEADILNLKSEISKDIFEKESDPLESQDQILEYQTNQQIDGSQLPVNMMQPQVNVIPQQMNAQHQPMNIFPYPVGVHAPVMNIQRHPYNIHPQLPVHLHTGVPLVQVAAPPTVTQGLPPPPPPPPPSQQVNYIAAQPDGKQLQGIPNASHVSNNMSTPVLPAPTAAPGNTGTVQGPSSGNTSSSSHSKASNAAVKLAESKVSVTVEASADSSKTDKKLQIQEKAAQEVKLAIKPFYQNKDITKEEYKEIVRKAVDKVCHSKSGEVNSTKVANLVKAYVDKYKYSRKGSQKKTVEEPVSAENNVG
ncbi:protein SCAF11 [Heterocephalus glaber]|uniref:Protein SCAF11 n=1 Tax=Heterocephalus glaber TaxID=10181 RepID=A0AAX6PYI9_HETGA|nr:protein SCAF11 [Heterocephalus glaber]